MRKGLITTIVLVVIVIALSFAAQRLTNTGASAGADQAPVSDAYQVTIKGVVVPERVARLTFPATGQVVDIAVKAGDAVTTGQVLAQQDTQALALQVQMATHELQLQQAQLEQLLDGTSAGELAAAQANYDAAVAALATVKAGPRAEEVAIAQAGLERARVALDRAQAAYDAVHNLPDIGARPESLALQTATIDYQQAKAAYDLATAGPEQSQIKEAEGRVATALAQLDKLRGQAPLREMQIAQANVARAETALAQAELALQQTSLTAPLAGTVSSIDMRVGDRVAPGTTVLTVASLDRLQVELTDLDEWACTQVEPGQAVTLIVPGLKNRSLQGRLESISLQPTESNGSSVYKAIVLLNEQSPGLRWGMAVEMPLKVSSD